MDTRLLRYSAGRAPGWTALLVLAAMLSVATVLLLPSSLARAIDAALTGEAVQPAVLWLGGLLAGATLASVLSTWAGAAISAAVAVSLRRNLTARVLGAGVPGKRLFTAGDLTSRLTFDAASGSSLVPAFVSASIAVLLCAGAVLGLALVDWLLAVVFAACVPVVVVLMRRFVDESSGYLLRYQELYGVLSARLMEALAGARTIRACGTVEREVERTLVPLPDLATAGRAGWDAQRRAVWRLSLLGPISEIAVLAVAGVRESQGRITAGQWIAVAGYVAIASGFLDAVDTLMLFAHVRGAMARLAEVLAMPAGPGGPRGLPPGPGAITFRSVTARADGEVVLDRVDLDLPAGVLVAVVGGSGTGKSTFAACAGGLRAPDEGEVLLDGVPVTQIRPDELRRAVAYAFGRPALLGETIHDTVAYGSAGLSPEQVRAAAVRVEADGFIRRLPDGYATRLAEAPLSDGQAQRIGLARAVARDRRVLILDDATSSLDTVTEAVVTATIATVFAGRTRIVVAHRAATAARADLVLWLDAGRVRAVGSHASLCRDPDYRAMFGDPVAKAEHAAWLRA